jgi:apolipoprotein N-acyltransferase
VLPILKKSWPWLAATASGLLGVLCFAPFDQSWLCWIAVTPLIAAIWFSGENSRRRWLRNLLLGYLAGIVFFTGTFGWLGALGDLYQSFFLHGLSFLLSIYLGVHFAFWAWLIGFLKPAAFTASWRNLLVAFVAACAWATHEWIRGWLFSGFGWNGLGVALHADLPMIQIAEFTGVAGLSFAVAFANIIAVTTPIRLFAEARTHRMRPHFDLTLTMVTIVALLAFGLHAIQNASPRNLLRVAAVQTNIPQDQKLQGVSTEQILDTWEKLNALAVEHQSDIKLIAWPEGSFPERVSYDKSVLEFPGALAERSGADFLFGADYEEGERAYNAAFLVSPNGESQVYQKVHLVPFGEYIPLRHSFPPFAAIAGIWVPGDFNAGTSYTVFDLTSGRAKAAPLICFEDTVGDLVRKFVVNGANLLVDVTNDGWFLRSSGSRQHLNNAIFRCIENRRPMVRAANTGVTCFVDEFGRFIRATSHVAHKPDRLTPELQDDNGSTFVEGVLTGEVNVLQDRQITFYTRHGELFAESCAVVTALAIVWVFVRRKRGVI